MRQSDFGIEPPPETGTHVRRKRADQGAQRRAHHGAAGDRRRFGHRSRCARAARPGVYSARYAGEDASDEANLDENAAANSKALPDRSASARYRCVIVYVARCRRSRAADRRRHLGRPHRRRRRAAAAASATTRSFVPAGDTRTAARDAGRGEEPRQPSRPGAARLFLAQLRVRADEHAAARAVRALSLVRAEMPVLRFQLAHAARRAARAALHRHACCGISMRKLPDVAGRPLVSIFLGGGTPSLFSPEAIGRLLEHARKHCGFADGIEVTLEANPGTIERGRFARISRRRRQPRFARRAELRRATAEDTRPHPLGRRDAPRRRRAARRGAREFQSRPDVRAARPDRSEARWRISSAALALASGAPLAIPPDDRAGHGVRGRAARCSPPTTSSMRCSTRSLQALAAARVSSSTKCRATRAPARAARTTSTTGRSATTSASARARTARSRAVGGRDRAHAADARAAPLSGGGSRGSLEPQSRSPARELPFEFAMNGLRLVEGFADGTVRATHRACRSRRSSAACAPGRPGDWSSGAADAGAPPPGLAISQRDTGRAAARRRIATGRVTGALAVRGRFYAQTPHRRARK